MNNYSENFQTDAPLETTSSRTMPNFTLPPQPPPQRTLKSLPDQPKTYLFGAKTQEEQNAIIGGVFGGILLLGLLGAFISHKYYIMPIKKAYIHSAYYNKVDYKKPTSRKPTSKKSTSKK